MCKNYLMSHIISIWRFSPDEVTLILFVLKQNAQINQALACICTKFLDLLRSAKVLLLNVNDPPGQLFENISK
jgi:hypothetical protein